MTTGIEDDFELADKLKEAIAPGLNSVQMKMVQSELDGGEAFFAIDDLLNFAVANRVPVPADLVEAVTDMYPKHDGEGVHEERLHGFLDRVLVA